MVAALIAADVVTGAIAWRRLLGRRYFAGAGRPSFELARRIYIFGLRGQVGSIMYLVNLRLDFMIVDLLAGPAILGIYAVASKFAELVRLLPISFEWVLYPRFAGKTATDAWSWAAWLAPRAAARHRARGSSDRAPGQPGDPAVLRWRLPRRRRADEVAVDRALGRGGVRRRHRLPLRPRPARAQLARHPRWRDRDGAAGLLAHPSLPARRRLDRIDRRLPDDDLAARPLLPADASQVRRASHGRWRPYPAWEVQTLA